MNPSKQSSPTSARPPVHTLVVELLGWTLDRTTDFPKSHRFTFGQRLDSMMLDGVMLVTRCVFEPASEKPGILDELNLQWEQLRVLWRLVRDRGWISVQQHLFVAQKIDEIGRMTGAWKRSLPRRTSQPPATTLED